MPSLFSKFKHRKSLSQSSNSSDQQQQQQPPSPHSPARQSFSNSNRGSTQESPSSRIRQSLDQPRSNYDQNSKRLSQPNLQPNPNLNPLPLPGGSRQDDVIVIDKTPKEKEIDSKGHSKPFIDESERPELPTTSSNVNNPIPVTGSGSSGSRSSGLNSGSNTNTNTTTNYIPQDEIDPHKPLPAVPEVQSPPVHTNDLRSFPIPPNSSSNARTHEDDFEPTIPPKSPQRNSISSPSQGYHHDRVKSPPLPHVDSINRSAIHNTEEERPGLIGSSSRPLKSGEGEIVQGNYPHVTNLPHSEKEENLNELLATSGSGQNDKIDIPSRGSSLYHQPRSGQQIGNESLSSNFRSSSSEIPQIPQLDFQTHRREGGFSNPSSALDPISKHPEGVLNERFNNLTIDQSGGLTLEEHRNQMISQIAEDTESRASKRKQLTPQGIEAFKSAGMHHLLDTESSIDIRSKEFEPVVKETIFPLEHTEYTTILTRCIHKTHYLPLIQPIHDPNPIRLATRHRIFDSTTGKWHEVIGDSAAISILGEDVFRNGQKSFRELRKPAYEGLEPMDEDAIRMAKEAGLVSGNGLSTYQGIKDYEYSNNQQDTIPIKGEFKDVSIDGIGQGQGKGRVLEREYLLKDADKEEEEKGDWKEIATYVGIGTGKLSRTDKEDDKVGLAI